MTKKLLTKGRQAITMSKIKDKSHLGVTFSKRRNGLFKKASELVTLCGVQLALLVFSPGNKVYSFGSPNVYVVIDRFLSGGHVKQPHGDLAANKAQESRIKGLNARLQEIERAVEAEKSIAKKLKEQVAAQTNTFAVTTRDQLNYPQLLELRGLLEQLKSRISSEINARLMNNNIATPSNFQNNGNPPLIGQYGILFNNSGGKSWTK